MENYPIYDADGEEELGFMNIWRGEQPQTINGVSASNNPYAVLYSENNLISMRLTEQEFVEMLSALYVGAEFAYPEKYLQIVFNLLKGIQSPVLFEAECIFYPPYAPFIAYPLQNPYTQPDFIPDGYEMTPMIVVTDENIGEFPQNNVGDIVVPFGAITLDTNWFEDISGQLPTIAITVEGSGEAEITLLNQAQGGLAIITVDAPPNLIDILAGIITGADNIVDVQLDNISFPPETATEHVFPVKIEGEGSHIIYVVFLPIVDDSLLPLRFGGGFRGVELCEFGSIPEMGITAIRLNDETCTLESLLDGVWIPVTNWGAINDCVVPNAISSEAAADAISENATIIEMQNDIQQAGDDIVILEQNVTQTNVVPSNPDYDLAKICNAAEYIATQIIELSNETWTESGSVTVEEFLAALLEGSTGYIADLITLLYDAAVPSHATTPSELAAAKDDLVRALYCNNLDKAAAIAEIEASGSITTYARDLIVASLNSISDARFALWAFIGAETESGDCDCGESFLLYAWNYISFPCSYGLPSGWSLVVNDGICGDNGGLIKGIHDSSNSPAATSCTFTITPASGVHIREISYNGVKKSGGVGTCQVSCGGYSETDTLQATVEGFLHIMDETGAITFVLNQSGASNNGVAVQAWNISYEIP